MEQNENIARKLRALRAEYNLTQAEVAKKLGITQQTYSKYESGKINIDSKAIIQICDIYGISSDYLLGIEKGVQNAGEGDRPPEADNVAYTITEDEINKIVEKVLSEITGK